MCWIDAYIPNALFFRLSNCDGAINEEKDEQERQEEIRKVEGLAKEIILPMLKDMLFMLQPPDKDSLSQFYNHAL